MEPQEMSMKPSLLEKWGALKFAGLLFLIPVFVIPAASVPFQSGKAMLVYLGAFLFLALWILDRLKKGSVSIPWTTVLPLALLIPVVSLVSAIFSSSPMQGIIGKGFELDTVFSMLSFVFLLFIAPQVLRSKQSVFNTYLALIASFGLLFVFTLIRVVGGADVFTLNILTSSVGNLVGSWNDLGVFAGLISVLTLVMLEIVPPKGILKWILYAALVASLLLLSVVNFDAVWYVLGLIALSISIYSFTFGKVFKEGSQGMSRPSWRDARGVSKLPFSVLIVSIIFILSGNQLFGGTYPSINIGNRISQALGINQIEARPNLLTTLSIAGETLKTNTLLGAGPNQFSYEWQKYRPQVVNESAFWNIDFNFGLGVIPSVPVTLGVIGILIWLAFLGILLYMGIKSLRRPKEDVFAYYLSTTAFVATLYLWIVAFVYPVSTSLLALSFAMTGVFIATLVMDGSVRERIFSFNEEPATRFVALLVSIVIIVGLAASLVFVGTRNVALAYFNGALVSYAKDGDLARAEEKVRKAIALSGVDTYYRGLSEIALVNLNRVAAAVTAQTPPDQVRNQLQLLLGGAIASAQSARDANPADYQNWMALARSYESVVPLRIAGAYDSAKAAYDEALLRNPTSPLVLLSLARLEAVNGSNTAAKEHINGALTLKRNYTDAIFFLAQIQVAEGDLKNAITSVEAAAVINPNDATTLFQLGFLYYNDRDYERSALALERAISLEANYANARYFLGLSYDRLGRKGDAIAQFEAIEATNPDNQEVKNILANLRAGKNAFADVKPPLDSTPEKRKAPPISEDSDSSDI